MASPVRHARPRTHNVDQFARYIPELGWSSVLAIVSLPRARAHFGLLERPLRMLISRDGHAFIQRIEVEAVTSPAFRELLGRVRPDPVFRIPVTLWERLTAAAGKPIGPMAPHMAALYASIPDLAETAAAELDPLDRTDAPVLSEADPREQAEGWVVHHESFWAWEELNRILEQDGPEPTWKIILAILERANERAMGPLGAGILERLLGEHGAVMIERVESRAAADQKFRFCLSHAWQGDMPDETWERVVAARGDEPQRG